MHAHSPEPAAARTPLAARADAPAALPVLPAFAGLTPLTWRRARRTDIRRIHALVAEAGRVDHPRTRFAKDQIAIGLSGAHFSRRTDSMIALGPDGMAIAFGTAKRTEDPTTEVEVALEGTVRPDHRGLGIGRALLSWQEARARQILTETGGDLPAIITVASREENPQNQALYASTGFAPVRWWLELWRPLSAELPATALPAGIALVPFTARRSEATRAAVNDAFRDHWGTQPITRREWEAGGGASAFAPKLSRLAIAGGGTLSDPSRVVGFALSDVDRDAWAANGGPFGELGMIGVVRDWRGRGLSTALIADTLRAYRGAGLDRAMLNVDAENPSGALGMYERLGFRAEDRAVTFAKRV